MEAEKEKEVRGGLSGSTLKIIAMVSMLIDHIGASLIERGILLNNAVGINDLVLGKSWAQWYQIDMILRYIGRIAFPLFCFLLVEGFFHTHDVKKYIGRLAVFSVISEIPFDMAVTGTLFDFSYQNVFFTLTIGVMVMAGLEFWARQEDDRQTIRNVKSILVVAAGMVTASLLRTDYDYFGVLFIAILYILHDQRKKQIIAGSIAVCWEITAPLAFVPVWFYNGKRGLKLKYVFYAFYPLHLLILGLILKFIVL